VVDASLVLALLLRESRSVLANRAFVELKEAGEDMFAPVLIRYEIASSLTRAVAEDRSQAGDIEPAISLYSRLGIRLLDPSNGIARLVNVARALQRKSAYDAAYLVLAEELDAELWTIDGPLYRNAVSIGARVRLVA